VIEPERHEIILRLLRQNRFAGVHDFRDIIRVSEATIRRDLVKLEEDGFIRRVHGGAELAESAVAESENFGELPFEYRKGLMLEKKRLIAKQAASLCEDEDIIMIDGGSTTFQMAQFLYPLRCKLITNSFAIAELLIKNGRSQVVIPGGMVYKNSQLILDPFGGNFFDNYAASKLFMGVGGIRIQGFTNTDPLLIQMERNMIKSAEEVIILADSSKFEGRGDLMLCSFEEVSMLITDSGIKAEQRKMIEETGITLIIV